MIYTADVIQGETMALTAALLIGCFAWIGVLFVFWIFRPVVSWLQARPLRRCVVCGRVVRLGDTCRDCKTVSIAQEAHEAKRQTQDSGSSREGGAVVDFEERAL